MLNTCMYLYVINNTENKCKIGFSSDPHKRLKTLQTGSSTNLKLHHYVEVPAARVKMLESKIHHELSYLRLRGEWFNIEPSKAQKMLDWLIIRHAEDPLLE